MSLLTTNVICFLFSGFVMCVCVCVDRHQKSNMNVSLSVACCPYAVSVSVYECNASERLHEYANEWVYRGDCINMNFSFHSFAVLCKIIALADYSFRYHTIRTCFMVYLEYYKIMPAAASKRILFWGNPNIHEPTSAHAALSSSTTMLWKYNKCLFLESWVIYTFCNIISMELWTKFYGALG